MVLEMTTPTRPPLSVFYRVWFDRLVPALGRLAGGLAWDRSRRTAGAGEAIGAAYSYLPNSVKRFPGPAELAAEMGRAGIVDVSGCCWPAGSWRSIRAPSPRRHGRERRRATHPSAAGGRRAAAHFQQRGPGLRDRMANVERHLELVTAEAGTPLAGLANATVTSGGKRLRPLLVMLAAEAAGGAQPTPEGEERLVRAAVAVELVHSATLVHDDLIDGAALRRGHPTVAARAGHRAAVATGDLLFSRAFAELARNQDPAQLQALSDASSALAEGELLQREDAYCARVSVERYLERCALKTAALFEAACRLGALSANERSRGLADALGAFARRIGLAFQVLDDVLDVSGPVERTGKPRGNDLLEGTVTLPSSSSPRNA